MDSVDVSRPVRDLRQSSRGPHHRKRQYHRTGICRSTRDTIGTPILSGTCRFDSGACWNSVSTVLFALREFEQRRLSLVQAARLAAMTAEPLAT